MPRDAFGDAPENQPSQGAVAPHCKGDKIDIFATCNVEDGDGRRFAGHDARPAHKPSARKRSATRLR